MQIFNKTNWALVKILKQVLQFQIVLGFSLRFCNEFAIINAYSRLKDLMPWVISLISIFEHKIYICFFYY